MKSFHSATITVFSSDTSLEKRREGLLRLFSFPVKLESEVTTDLDNNNLHILRVRLKKDKEINAFFKTVFAMISFDDKTLILEQLDTRIDEGCQFFLRFRANPWIFDNVLELTDEGDCYHVRTLVAAYPAKKERAIEIVKKFIETS